MSDSLEYVHSAMRRAVARSVHQATTVEVATVTAVGADSATITLRDGATVGGVPVLSPFVPRVGDIVRVATQGASLLILGGSAVPNAGEQRKAQDVSWSFTSTTATTPATPWRLGFTAPRSGTVNVHLRARLTPTATARAIAGVRILSNPAGAVLFIETQPLIEVPAGGGTITAAGFTWFTGLTPGTNYYADVVGASGLSGQSVTVANPRLLVAPAP